MLAALEFSQFEAYGRFSNGAVGVYLGLLTIILAVAAFVILLKRRVLQ